MISPFFIGGYMVRPVGRGGSRPPKLRLSLGDSEKPKAVEVAESIVHRKNKEHEPDPPAIRKDVKDVTGSKGTKGITPLQPESKKAKVPVEEFIDNQLQALDETLVSSLELHSLKINKARSAPFHSLKIDKAPFAPLIDAVRKEYKGHDFESSRNVSEILIQKLLSKYSSIEQSHPNLAKECANSVARDLNKVGSLIDIDVLLKNPDSHVMLSSLDFVSACDLLSCSEVNIKNLFPSNEASRESIKIILEKLLKEILSSNEELFNKRQLINVLGGLNGAMYAYDTDLATIFIQELQKFNETAPKKLKKFIKLEDIVSSVDVEKYRDISHIKVLVSVSDDPQARIYELLNAAIKANNESLVSAIIEEYELDISNKRETYLNKAFDQGNLTLMRMLSPDQWKDRVIAEFETLVDDKTKVTDKLQDFFLNSNLGDLKELTNQLGDRYPSTQVEIDQVLEYASTGGTLIARFPSPDEQHYALGTYGIKSGFRTYRTQQFTYGARRFEKVSEVLQLLRENPDLSLSEVYQKLNGGKDWRDRDARTGMGEVYSRFVPLILPYFKAEEVSSEGFQVSSSGILHFTEGEEKENLVGFRRDSPNFIDWTHPDPKKGVHWLERIGISEDYTNLVNAKVDLDNPGEVNAYKKQLAEFYWKGVQLMPTMRGNSQTMLELHQMMLMLKGIQPSPPSREWVLPDCVALCKTKQEFIEKFYGQCWDN